MADSSNSTRTSTHHFDRPKPYSLANLTPGELDLLWQAYQRAADQFGAFLNQPRVEGYLAKIVEDLWEDCHAQAEKALIEAEGRTPDNDEDRRARARLLVRGRLDGEWWSDVGDGWFAGLPRLSDSELTQVRRAWASTGDSGGRRHA